MRLLCFLVVETFHSELAGRAPRLGEKRRGKRPVGIAAPAEQRSRIVAPCEGCEGSCTDRVVPSDCRLEVTLRFVPELESTGEEAGPSGRRAEARIRKVTGENEALRPGRKQ